MVLPGINRFYYTFVISSNKEREWASPVSDKVPAIFIIPAVFTTARKGPHLSTTVLIACLTLLSDETCSINNAT